MKKQGQDMFHQLNHIEYNGDFSQLKTHILALISNLQQNQYATLFKQISYAISPQLPGQQLLKYIYCLNYLIQNLGEDHNSAMDALALGFNKLFTHQQQSVNSTDINIYYIAQYLQFVQMFFKYYYQIHQNSKFTQFLIYLIQQEPIEKLIDILIQNSHILQLLLNMKSIYALVKQILLKYEWNCQKANKLIGVLLPNKKELFELLESDLNITDNKQAMRLIYSVLSYSQQKHKINIEKIIKLITTEIDKYQNDKMLNVLSKEHVFLINQVLYCIFSQETSFALHKHKVKLLEIICNIYGAKIVLVKEYPFTLYDQLQSQHNLNNKRTINDYTQLNIDNMILSTNDCVYSSESFFMLRYMLNRWEIHGTRFLNRLTNNLYLMNSMQFQQYMKKQQGKNIDQLCFEVLARTFALIEIGVSIDVHTLAILNRINNFYPFNQFNNLIQYINAVAAQQHSNYIINKNVQLLSFQNKQYYLNFYKQNNETDVDIQEQIFNGLDNFRNYIQALEQLRNGQKSADNFALNNIDYTQNTLSDNDTQQKQIVQNDQPFKSAYTMSEPSQPQQQKQLQLIDVPENEEEANKFQLVFK